MTNRNDKKHICPVCGEYRQVVLEASSFGPAYWSELRHFIHGEIPNLTQVIKHHLNLELSRPSQFRSSIRDKDNA